MEDPKPIRAILRLKNNAIIERRERLGFDSCVSFTRAFGLQYSHAIGLETMNLSPFRKDGALTSLAAKLCECLGALPEDLWPGEVLLLKKNVSTRKLDIPEMLMLAGDSPELLEDGLEVQRNLEIREMAERCLNSLPNDRLRNIVQWVILEEETLEFAAERLGLSRERTRQLLARALHKMREAVPEADPLERTLKAL